MWLFGSTERSGPSCIVLPTVRHFVELCDSAVKNSFNKDYKGISTAAPYFRKFLQRGALLVGNLTFVKFVKSPQITPQMVALKLLANLLERHRGQRTQSQRCCSARE
jgi:hypothetical protein